MSREPPTVEPAGADDSQVVDTLVLSFATDPLMRWAFPTASEYLEWFPAFVERYGGAAFAAGTAYVVAETAGAALWLPPGTAPDDEGVVSLLERALSAEKQTEAWTAFAGVQEHYPDEPHWHLPLIGVDPDHQGRGYGSALLEHALERIDQAGEPAVLESANPRNLSLYLRYDFELAGQVQVGSMPPIFPMVRESRS